MLIVSSTYPVCAAEPRHDVAEALLAALEVQRARDAHLVACALLVPGAHHSSTTSQLNSSNSGIHSSSCRLDVDTFRGIRRVVYIALALNAPRPRSLIGGDSLANQAH